MSACSARRTPPYARLFHPGHNQFLNFPPAFWSFWTGDRGGRRKEDGSRHRSPVHRPSIDSTARRRYSRHVTVQPTPARADGADNPPLPPFNLWRTLRFGIREAWDALGFVCAASLTLFLALPVPVVLALMVARVPSPMALIAAAVAGSVASAAVLGPLYAGTCSLVHRTIVRDEPSYMDLLRGTGRLYWRATGLALVESAVTGVLLGNLVFYARLRGFGWLLITTVFLYLCLFWGMNCLYHWPLLVAAEEGIIRRDDGGRPRLLPVFRNGFLLATSAPIYSLGLLVVLAVVLIPAGLSGVGMALVGPGLAAFLTTQATRDQLVRFGVLPPPPDLESPVNDVWRMRG